MKAVKYISVAFAAAVSSTSAAHHSESPIRQVAKLLTTLRGKIEKDGQAELKSFDEYSDWCHKVKQEKSFEIKDFSDDVEALTATIGSASSEASTAASKIEELQARVDGSKGDLEGAERIRATEAQDFQASEKQMIETVQSLGKAANSLQEMGASLLQADGLLGTMKEVVAAAGLSSSDNTRLMAMATRASSRNSSAIDMLENFKDKAELELSDLRNAEAKAKNYFALLKESLESEIKATVDDLREASSYQSEAKSRRANAEAELSNSNLALAKAQSGLQQIENSCKAVMADHQTSAKSREQELEAIDAAQKSISKMDGADEQVYGVASFLQSDSKSELKSPGDLKKLEVVSFLRNLARMEKSASLTQLAGSVKMAAEGNDAVMKIKDLIDGRIQKLEMQVAEDQKHKAYCDEETTTTAGKHDKLTTQVEKLAGKKDKAEAESAALRKEAMDIQKDLSKLASSQASADQLRMEEKATYEQTKKDLEQGLQGARVAVKVLRNYYKSQAALLQLNEQIAKNTKVEISALLQLNDQLAEDSKGEADTPEVPTSHSRSGDAEGILSMLELVESHLGKSLANTKIQEDSAAAAYDDLAQENKLAVASLEKDAEYKTKQAASLDKAIIASSQDMGSAQTELEAVKQYAKSIQESCAPQTPNLQEDRASETASLKEALMILGPSTSFLQRGRRHHAAQGT